MAREKGTPRPPKPPGVESNSRQNAPQTKSSKAERDRALHALIHDIPDATELSELIFGLLQGPRMVPAFPFAPGDRHAAIVCSAAIELALKRNIAGHLARDADLAAVFERYPGAPLSSFAARTVMARALGIIDDAAAADLAVIRRVRNIFAHTVHPLTFANKEMTGLVAEIAKLSDPHWHLFNAQYPSGRDRYVISCAVHYTALEQYVPPSAKPPVNMFAEVARALIENTDSTVSEEMN